MDVAKSTVQAVLKRWDDNHTSEIIFCGLVFCSTQLKITVNLLESKKTLP